MKNVINFLVKFFQCFFCWRIEASPEEEVRNADVILGQSFAMGKNRTPGESNRQLAKIGREIFDLYNIPMALQWEIADCLPYLPIELVVRESRKRKRYFKLFDIMFHLNTFEVLSQMWEFCQRKSWKKAIILAHPDQYWRCWMVAKRLGFTPISIDVSFVKCDPESVQFWTKYSWIFRPYEVVGRILFLFLGRM